MLLSPLLALILLLVTPNLKEKRRQEDLEYRRHSDMMRLVAANQSAPAPVQIPAPEPVKRVDPLASLATLAELRDKGLLTPDEFGAKKAELLSRV